MSGHSGPSPRTPEEVAADFGLPLAAVHEAVHYCLHNDEVLQREREEVVAEIRRRGLDKPPYVPMQGVVDMLCLPQDIALREGGIRGDRTCLGPGSMTPIRAE